MKEVESHCLLQFSLELGCLRSVVPVVLFWGNTKVQHIHHLRHNLSGALPSGGKGTKLAFKLTALLSGNNVLHISTVGSFN